LVGISVTQPSEVSKKNCSHKQNPTQQLIPKTIRLQKFKSTITDFIEYCKQRLFIETQKTVAWQTDSQLSYCGTITWLREEALLEKCVPRDKRGP